LPQVGHRVVVVDRLSQTLPPYVSGSGRVVTPLDATWLEVSWRRAEILVFTALILLFKGWTPTWFVRFPGGRTLIWMPGQRDRPGILGGFSGCPRSWLLITRGLPGVRLLLLRLGG
jgi:hypothetical protein